MQKPKRINKERLRLWALDAKPNDQHPVVIAAKEHLGKLAKKLGEPLRPVEPFAALASADPRGVNVNVTPTIEWIESIDLPGKPAGEMVKGKREYSRAQQLQIENIETLATFLASV